MRNSLPCQDVRLCWEGTRGLHVPVGAATCDSDQKHRTGRRGQRQASAATAVPGAGRAVSRPLAAKRERGSREPRRAAGGDMGSCSGYCGLGCRGPWGRANTEQLCLLALKGDQTRCVSASRKKDRLHGLWLPASPSGTTSPLLPVLHPTPYLLEMRNKYQDFLAVQWLRLHAANARSTGSILGQ